MPLTDDQLKALGLSTDTPPMPPPTSAPPSIIGTPPPAQYPRSILGDKIPSGGLIPQTHQEGKEEYQQFKPQITAPAGTTDYFRQRQEQLDYNAKHPWGDPVSAHPGVLGKIGHVAAAVGNIAGDIVAPGTMALIPGTQLHNAVVRGQNEEGINQGVENEAREANTAATEEATKEAPEKLALQKEQVEGKEEPQADPIFDKNGNVVGFHNGKELIGLENPKLTPDMRQIAAAAQPKEGKQTPAHVTYDQGIPVSVTDADGKTYDVNDPKLPEELKPLVTSANRAHTQHTTEETNKQAQAFAQQEKMFNERQAAPSNSTKTMLEAAPHVKQFVDRIKPLIDQMEKSGDLGPGAGRWNEFWAGRVGAGNPTFTKLRTDVGLLSTLLMRMHVGARGGEYMMQHFSDMINSGKQDPQTMRAALGEIEAYANQLTSEIPGKKGGGGTGPKVGDIEDGFRFKGGDPSKKENWEQAKK